MTFASGIAQAVDDAPIALPAPSLSGAVSVEQALAERRSVRRLRTDALALEHLSQLLWAAQGVANERGFRTAPSAGALYPLTVYAVIGSVTSLQTGLHQYVPDDHALVVRGDADMRAALVDAAFGQSWMGAAPVILVIAGREATTRRKYGGRAPFFVAVEAGHAAQNISLQAQALGLGSTIVGGFDVGAAHRVLGLPDDEQVLLLLPVGVPAD